MAYQVFQLTEDWLNHVNGAVCELIEEVEADDIYKAFENATAKHPGLPIRVSGDKMVIETTPEAGLELLKTAPHCMVCDKITDSCPPSPFFPYSGWRCKACCAKHLLPYDDLLMLLCGSGAKSYEERVVEFKDWWKGSDGTGPDDGDQYWDKYVLPTLEFFEKTKEQAWQESKERCKELWGIP